MSKRIRWISALSAAVAAALAIVVVTSSAGGTDDPAGELAVFETGQPIALDTSLLASFRSSGIGIAANDAVTVPAPDGSGERWVLAQGGDNVCLVRRGEGGDPIMCGTTTALRRGAILGFTPDEAAAASLGLPERIDPDAPSGTLVAPAGDATSRDGSVSFHGVAANDVTTAAAVTADGRVLVRDTVEDNLFVLPDVALGEVANIRLTHTSGEDSLQSVGFR